MRALMAANALVALAAWGCVLWGRSEQYARKAEEFRFMSGGCQISIYLLTHGPHGDDRMIEWCSKEKLEFYQKRMAHAERLYRKYRRAARFPWLTPEADPPEPLSSIW